MRTLIFIFLIFFSFESMAYGVSGEPAKLTQAIQENVALRGGGNFDQTSTQIAFGEIDYNKIDALRRNQEVQYSVENNIRAMALPVSLDMNVQTDTLAGSDTTLQWYPAGNGKVARISVSTDNARAIRSGFYSGWFRPGMEIRVFSTGNPIPSLLNYQQIQSLSSNGIVWSAITNGSDQYIELYTPNETPSGYPLVYISNFFDYTSSRLPEDLKAALSCMIGVQCASRSLPPEFRQLEAATAKMFYQKNGGGYVCTGTLINDSNPNTQIPFFLTASHCVDSQDVANTLLTFWEAESQTCAATGFLDELYVGGIQMGGGATFVNSISNLDITLLRLNRPAPPSSYFMGWDATLFEFEITDLNRRFPTLSVHHPAGENKAVTTGVQIRTVGYPLDQIDRGGAHVVSASNGSFAGGSSGHGLLRLVNGEYRLYGTLIGTIGGGCSNAGQPYNSRTWEPGNVFIFSRFDYWYRLVGNTIIGPNASTLNTVGATNNLAKWNYSGTWYVPQNSGWGFAIQQFESQVLVLIFAYNNGQPEWYYVQSAWTGQDTITAPIVKRTNNGLWGANTFRFENSVDTTVGNMRLEFRDRGVMVMTGTINGRSIGGTMERLE